MDLEELARERAAALGIPLRGQRLGDLIRAIQEREGYEACFCRGHLDCPEEGCRWRCGCDRVPRYVSARPWRSAAGDSDEIV